MTVPSSGDRMRRGGRRPGWALLTVLLVLAIAASTALVFTNRVELLKLAVILALWAAVVGAFVSVIYRRQSDVDAARARDLKLVYDLQLDREIAARREYELNVEANLRRELAGEIRAQSADEVASLRAELLSLRRSLEILFDADLSHRPALETDRSFGEWSGEPARLDRVASSRITEVRRAPQPQAAENPIIDVPEEPLTQEVPPQQPPAQAHRRSHRRRSEDTGWIPPVRPGPAPAGPGPAHRQRVAPPTPAPVAPPAAAPAPPTPAPAPPAPPAPSAPTPVQSPAAKKKSGRRAANGRVVGDTPAAPPQPEAPPEPVRRGRHSGAPETPGDRPAAPATARHRGADDAADETGAPPGQSVAELLARLQHDGPAQGGRRRRRED